MMGEWVDVSDHRLDELLLLLERPRRLPPLPLRELELLLLLLLLLR
jgi:hypothetical protein